MPSTFHTGKRNPAWLWWGIGCGVLMFGLGVQAEEKLSPRSDRETPREVLAPAEWREMETAVDRGLDWLMRQQRPDGAFQPRMRDEPGITGLCLLAFLSRGHLPGEGPYGDKLTRTVKFLLDSQQKDGMIARKRHPYHGMYSHAIGAVVITELYGMMKQSDEPRHRAVIEQALEFTGHRYSQPKASPDDEGGWRYLRRHAVSDSDLSLTSWNVMFLRSAKNAGFDVETRLIDEALAYMERLYDPGRRTFRYEIHSDDLTFNHTRGMAGAGVLSLSLAGKHQTEMAQHAAKSILQQPFDQYAKPARGEQYPCYSAFYCSQAMFQMGGDNWSVFYPQLVRSIVQVQRDDGSWTMLQGKDIEYGVPYMTALTILALTPPYQLLPIFQR